MKAAVIAVALLLASCATAPTTPRQTVYALEGEYAAALAVGAAYVELPRCPSARDGLCSDPAKVAQLRQAVKTADVAIDAFETAARTNGDTVSTMLAASELVAALTRLTVELKVQP